MPSLVNRSSYAWEDEDGKKRNVFERNYTIVQNIGSKKVKQLR